MYGLITVIQLTTNRTENVCKALICIKRSPLTPLKKGGIRVKVPLLKGDLGGSQYFGYMTKDF